MHAQADDNVRMAGGGVFAALPWGFVGLQGAVSNSQSGTGFAVNANWDILNFKGPDAVLRRRDAKASVSALNTGRARSGRPASSSTTASGVLFPQYNYSWRFLASYSVPLTETLSATLSGRYQIADDKAFVISPYTLKGDRYGVDLTLSNVITPELSRQPDCRILERIVSVLGYDEERSGRFPGYGPPLLAST